MSPPATGSKIVKITPNPTAIIAKLAHKIATESDFKTWNLLGISLFFLNLIKTIKIKMYGSVIATFVMLTSKLIKAAIDSFPPVNDTSEIIAITIAAWTHIAFAGISYLFNFCIDSGKIPFGEPSIIIFKGAYINVNSAPR